MKSILAVLFTLISSSAFAVPVTWTLENVEFRGGGTASGSFVYDVDINSYSDISIVTTAGSILDGASYNSLATNDDTFPGPAFDSRLPVYSGIPADNDYTGLSVFFLSFQTPLSNSGGTHSIIGPFSVEGICGDPSCDAPSDAGPRDIISSASVSAVPVPAAVWLFGSALLLLGRLRRVG